ncbi:flippase [Bradyrhizobium sp. 76]|uniref:flippase n=1 Tax=Bradyrhizobium sp. 76 TaxID=2782680 RepID=UPI001FFA2048|nr:flippase [Bradyrhizobium sp. 76]MCK1404961.1 flippase [Bradyrhizobium sp. 76]
MSSTSAKNNAFYNLAGAIIPAVVAILTIPPYLREIGESRYGVLSVLWLIFGYFGLFDFGLSRATAHRLSTLRNSDPQSQATLFFSSVLLNAGLGLSVAAVFYVIAIPILNMSTDLAGELHSEMLRALPWITGFFPIALLNGVLVGCLEARERFFQLNLQQVVGAILLQCLPLAFVYVLGSNLEYAVAGAVAARTLAVAWMACDCLGWAFTSGNPRINRTYVKELLRYGGWITISNGINPILVGADQLLIGLQLNAAAVANYSVPSSMASKLFILPAALMRALFPRLANSKATEARDLSHKALIILSATMTLICVPAILLANAGLRMWIGNDFAQSSHVVAELLLVGTWVNGLAFVPYTLLQGQNKPAIIAKLHAAEVVPYILVLLLSIEIFGVAGAALAWCLRVTVDGCLMFYFADFYAGDLKHLVAPGAALLIAFLVAEAAAPGLLSALGWSAAILSLLFAFLLTRDEIIISLIRPMILRMTK